MTSQITDHASFTTSDETGVDVYDFKEEKIYEDELDETYRFVDNILSENSTPAEKRAVDAIKITEYVTMKNIINNNLLIQSKKMNIMAQSDDDNRRNQNDLQEEIIKNITTKSPKIQATQQMQRKMMELHKMVEIYKQKFLSEKKKSIRVFESILQVVSSPIIGFVATGVVGCVFNILLVSNINNPVLWIHISEKLSKHTIKSVLSKLYNSKEPLQLIQDTLKKWNTSPKLESGTATFIGMKIIDSLQTPNLYLSMVFDIFEFCGLFLKGEIYNVKENYGNMAIEFASMDLTAAKKQEISNTITMIFQGTPIYDPVILNSKYYLFFKYIFDTLNSRNVLNESKVNFDMNQTISEKIKNLLALKNDPRVKLVLSSLKFASTTTTMITTTTDTFNQYENINRNIMFEVLYKYGVNSETYKQTLKQCSLLTVEGGQKLFKQLSADNPIAIVGNYLNEGVQEFVPEFYNVFSEGVLHYFLVSIPDSYFKQLRLQAIPISSADDDEDDEIKKIEVEIKKISVYKKEKYTDDEIQELLFPQVDNDPNQYRFSALYYMKEFKKKFTKILHHPESLLLYCNGWTMVVGFIKLIQSRMVDIMLGISTNFIMSSGVYQYDYSDIVPITIFKEMLHKKTIHDIIKKLLTFWYQSNDAIKHSIDMYAAQYADDIVHDLREFLNDVWKSKTLNNLSTYFNRINQLWIVKSVKLATVITYSIIEYPLLHQGVKLALNPVVSELKTIDYFDIINSEDKLLRLQAFIQIQYKRINDAMETYDFNELKTIMVDSLDLKKVLLEYIIPCFHLSNYIELFRYSESLILGNLITMNGGKFIVLEKVVPKDSSIKMSEGYRLVNVDTFLPEGMKNTPVGALYWSYWKYLHDAKDKSTFKPKQERDDKMSLIQNRYKIQRDAQVRQNDSDHKKAMKEWDTANPAILDSLRQELNRIYSILSTKAPGPISTILGPVYESDNDLLSAFDTIMSQIMSVLNITDTVINYDAVMDSYLSSLKTDLSKLEDHDQVSIPSYTSTYVESNKEKSKLYQLNSELDQVNKDIQNNPTDVNKKKKETIEIELASLLDRSTKSDATRIMDTYSKHIMDATTKKDTAIAAFKKASQPSLNLDETNLLSNILEYDLADSMYKYKLRKEMERLDKIYQQECKDFISERDRLLQPYLRKDTPIRYYGIPEDKLEKQEQIDRKKEGQERIDIEREKNKQFKKYANTILILNQQMIRNSTKLKKEKIKVDTDDLETKAKQRIHDTIDGNLDQLFQSTLSTSEKIQKLEQYEQERKDSMDTLTRQYTIQLESEYQTIDESTIVPMGLLSKEYTRVTEMLDQYLVDITLVEKSKEPKTLQTRYHSIKKQLDETILEEHHQRTKLRDLKRVELDKAGRDIVSRITASEDAELQQTINAYPIETTYEEYLQERYKILHIKCKNESASEDERIEYGLLIEVLEFNRSVNLQSSFFINIQEGWTVPTWLKSTSPQHSPSPVVIPSMDDTIKAKIERQLKILSVPNERSQKTRVELKSSLFKDKATMRTVIPNLQNWAYMDTPLEDFYSFMDMMEYLLFYTDKSDVLTNIKHAILYYESSIVSSTSLKKFTQLKDEFKTRIQETMTTMTTYITTMISNADKIVTLRDLDFNHGMLRDFALQDTSIPTYTIDVWKGTYVDPYYSAVFDITETKRVNDNVNNVYQIYEAVDDLKRETYSESASRIVDSLLDISQRTHPTTRLYASGWDYTSCAERYAREDKLCAAYIKSSAEFKSQPDFILEELMGTEYKLCLNQNGILVVVSKLTNLNIVDGIVETSCSSTINYLHYQTSTKELINHLIYRPDVISRMYKNLNTYNNFDTYEKEHESPDTLKKKILSHFYRENTNFITSLMNQLPSLVSRVLKRMSNTEESLHFTLQRKINEILISDEAIAIRAAADAVIAYEEAKDIALYDETNALYSDNAASRLAADASAAALDAARQRMEDTATAVKVATAAAVNAKMSASYEDTHVPIRELQKGVSPINYKDIEQLLLQKQSLLGEIENHEQNSVSFGQSSMNDRNLELRYLYHPHTRNIERIELSKKLEELDNKLAPLIEAAKTSYESGIFSQDIDFFKKTSYANMYDSFSIKLNEFESEQKKLANASRIDIGAIKSKLDTLRSEILNMKKKIHGFEIMGYNAEAVGSLSDFIPALEMFQKLNPSVKTVFDTMISKSSYWGNNIVELETLHTNELKNVKEMCNAGTTQSTKELYQKYKGTVATITHPRDTNPLPLSFEDATDIGNATYLERLLTYSLSEFQQYITNSENDDNARCTAESIQLLETIIYTKYALQETSRRIITYNVGVTNTESISRIKTQLTSMANDFLLGINEIRKEDEKVGIIQTTTQRLPVGNISQNALDTSVRNEVRPSGMGSSPAYANQPSTQTGSVSAKPSLSNANAQKLSESIQQTVDQGLQQKEETSSKTAQVEEQSQKLSFKLDFLFGGDGIFKKISSLFSTPNVTSTGKSTGQNQQLSEPPKVKDPGQHDIDTICAKYATDWYSMGSVIKVKKSEVEEYRTILSNYCNKQNMFGTGVRFVIQLLLGIADTGTIIADWCSNMTFGVGGIFWQSVSAFLKALSCFPVGAPAIISSTIDNVLMANETNKDLGYYMLHSVLFTTLNVMDNLYATSKPDVVCDSILTFLRLDKGIHATVKSKRLQSLYTEFKTETYGTEIKDTNFNGNIHYGTEGHELNAENHILAAGELTTNLSPQLIEESNKLKDKLTRGVADKIAYTPYDIKHAMIAQLQDPSNPYLLLDFVCIKLCDTLVPRPSFFSFGYYINMLELLYCLVSSVMTDNTIDTIYIPLFMFLTDDTLPKTKDLSLSYLFGSKSYKKDVFNKEKSVNINILRDVIEQKLTKLTPMNQSQKIAFFKKEFGILKTVYDKCIESFTGLIERANSEETVFTVSSAVMNTYHAHVDKLKDDYRSYFYSLVHEYTTRVDPELLLQAKQNPQPESPLGLLRNIIDAATQKDEDIHKVDIIELITTFGNENITGATDNEKKSIVDFYKKNLSIISAAYNNAVDDSELRSFWLNQVKKMNSKDLLHLQSMFYDKNKDYLSSIGSKARVSDLVILTCENDRIVRINGRLLCTSVPKTHDNPLSEMSIAYGNDIGVAKEFKNIEIMLDPKYKLFFEKAFTNFEEAVQLLPSGHRINTKLLYIELEYLKLNPQAFIYKFKELQLIPSSARHKMNDLLGDPNEKKGLIPSIRTELSSRLDNGFDTLFVAAFNALPKEKPPNLESTLLFKYIMLQVDALYKDATFLMETNDPVDEIAMRTRMSESLSSILLVTDMNELFDALYDVKDPVSNPYPDLNLERVETADLVAIFERTVTRQYGANVVSILTKSKLSSLLDMKETRQLLHDKIISYSPSIDTGYKVAMADGIEIDGVLIMDGNNLIDGKDMLTSTSTYGNSLTPQIHAFLNAPDCILDNAKKLRTAIQADIATFNTDKTYLKEGVTTSNKLRQLSKQYNDKKSSTPLTTLEEQIKTLDYDNDQIIETNYDGIYAEMEMLDATIRAQASTLKEMEDLLDTTKPDNQFMVDGAQLIQQIDSTIQTYTPRVQPGNYYDKHIQELKTYQLQIQQLQQKVQLRRPEIDRLYKEIDPSITLVESTSSLGKPPQLLLDLAAADKNTVMINISTIEQNIQEMDKFADSTVQPDTWTSSFISYVTYTIPRRLRKGAQLGVELGQMGVSGVKTVYESGMKPAGSWIARRTVQAGTVVKDAVWRYTYTQPSFDHFRGFLQTNGASILLTKDQRNYVIVHRFDSYNAVGIVRSKLRQIGVTWEDAYQVDDYGTNLIDNPLPQFIYGLPPYLPNPTEARITKPRIELSCDLDYTNVSPELRDLFQTLVDRNYVKLHGPTQTGTGCIYMLKKEKQYQEQLGVFDEAKLFTQVITTYFSKTSNERYEVIDYFGGDAQRVNPSIQSKTPFGGGTSVLNYDTSTETYTRTISPSGIVPLSKQTRQQLYLHSLN
jgi:hypothetical protein